MKRTIGVYLGETPRQVGTLYHTSDGERENAAFEYAATWLAAADGYSIDPLLPLVNGPQYHKRPDGGSIFNSVIADTEPDGWARQVILRDHAKRRIALRETGTALPPLINSLDFLLEVPDTTRAGALRSQDEAGTLCRTVKAGERAAPPLLHLEQLLDATRPSKPTPNPRPTSHTCADMERRWAACAPSAQSRMTMTCC